MRAKRITIGVPILCACNCGGALMSRDYKGRARIYLPGHQSRVSNPGLDKMLALPPRGRGRHNWRADGKHWRTCRARARQTTNTDACTWEHLGHCIGPIQVAHVDGDYTNNDQSNLLALCTSHHRLLDNGKIDPKNPVMPPFRVGSDGKRRYLTVSGAAS